jgi:hypothetical protein
MEAPLPYVGRKRQWEEWEESPDLQRLWAETESQPPGYILGVVYHGGVYRV